LPGKPLSLPGRERRGNLLDKASVMDHIRVRLRILLITFLILLILGILGFMAVEKISLTDAVYFTIVTVTTVGYGDIHPATQLGKVLAIFLIVLGVGTFLGIVANATEMMLSRRERQSRMEKLNMVIGVFFTEVGTRLLTVFSDHDPDLEKIRKDLIVTDDWTDEDFFRVHQHLKQFDYTVDARKMSLGDLRGFLLSKRDFVVRLFENPMLLEHGSFPDLLRAVLHLTEELACRQSLGDLPDKDRDHLAGDIKRAYGQLVDAWLDYMKHLKDNYPYLFSLAMRTNPFDEKASPVVK
jgi:hypothetical protein